MVADPRRHVADQRREHRLLAVEISVECAQRDPRAARDPDDRAFRKAARPELGQRRVEDLAQGLLAARRARRLAVARRAWRQSAADSLRTHVARLRTAVNRFLPVTPDKPS